MDRSTDSLRHMGIQLLVTLYAIVSCCITEPLCSMTFSRNGSMSSLILTLLICVSGFIMWYRTLNFKSGLLLKFLSGVLLEYSLFFSGLCWLFLATNLVLDFFNVY